MTDQEVDTGNHQYQDTRGSFADRVLPWDRGESFVAEGLFSVSPARSMTVRFRIVVSLVGHILGWKNDTIHGDWELFITLFT